MAQLPIQNRRSIAPAPPPPQQDQQQEQTLFDYIWACITALRPDFAPQGEHEPDNAFFERMVKFIAPDGEMSEEAWATFDVEAQQWYDAGAAAIAQNQPIPPPDGYYLPETNNTINLPDQSQQPQQQAAPGKNPVPAGIAKWRAEQDAIKAAKAAATNGAAAPPNGRAPVQQQTQTRQPPPQQMPARGVPQQQPQQAQQPAVPQRRTQQAPVYTPPQANQAALQRRQAPAPQQQPQTQQWATRRQAPAPQQVQQQQAAPRRERAPRSQGVIDDLRAQVIYDPSITPADLIAYARSQGYTQVDSSVGAIVSQVRSIMNLLERMGRLAPAQ